MIVLISVFFVAAMTATSITCAFIARRYMNLNLRMAARAEAWAAEARAAEARAAECARRAKLYATGGAWECSPN